MNLSKNFTLEEMTFSVTAANKKIDNTPTEEVKQNLQALTTNVLQPLRDKWNKTIRVNSGYRSPELNKAIGGAANSQHIQGKAVDVTAGNKESNKELFDLMLKSGIPYDQLIDEYGYQWIHISYNGKNNRLQTLHLK